MALAALPEDSTPADILATLPVAIAALLRRRQGAAPLMPDPARGTADDLLRMAHGKAVAPVMADALDTYFTAVIDNAPLPGEAAATAVADPAICHGQPVGGRTTKEPDTTYLLGLSASPHQPSGLDSCQRHTAQPEPRHLPCLSRVIQK